MSSFIVCLNLVIVSFSGIYILTKALFVKYEYQILPVRYSKSQRTLKIGRMKENNTKSKTKPTESSDYFKFSESIKCSEFAESYGLLYNTTGYVALRGKN